MNSELILSGSKSDQVIFIYGQQITRNFIVAVGDIMTFEMWNIISASLDFIADIIKSVEIKFGVNRGQNALFITSRKEWKNNARQY